MNDLRGRTFADLVAGLNAGQHLAVDALVAFVDGELEAAARDRAAEHLTLCRTCAAEVAGQRHASRMVRSAEDPRVPATLLAALRAIPQTAGVSPIADRWAMNSPRTAPAVGTPNSPSVTRFGSAPPWGSRPSRPQRVSKLPGLGTPPSALNRRSGRSAAGAVVSGLVLGALLMTMFENSSTGGAAARQPEQQMPASTMPSILPATAPAAQLGVRSAGEPALLRTTPQPGWYGLGPTR